MTRKEGFAMIKGDLNAIQGLEDQKVVSLARLLHLMVQKTDRPRIEMVVQFQKLLSENLDPTKLEMLDQFLKSMAANMEGPVSENGSKLVNEMTHVALEVDEKKLILLLAEVTRSVIKAFIEEEKPAGGLDNED